MRMPPLPSVVRGQQRALSRPLGLKRRAVRVQMAGDAACLARTLESLDEWTIVAMRGSEEHAEEDLALMARTLRRTKSLQARGSNGTDAAALSQSADAVAILMQVVGQMQVLLTAPLAHTVHACCAALCALFRGLYAQWSWSAWRERRVECPSVG